MKKNLLYVLLCCIAGMTTLTSRAQLVSGKKLNNNAADQSIFEEGEFWFELMNYKAALAEYSKLVDKYPDEEILNYRVGVCQLSMSDKWEDALARLKKLPYEKYQKTEFPFYLGCAYHYNLMFDEAIAEFNYFIAGKAGNKAMKAEARFYIANCQNGKTLKSTPVEVKIANLGAPVNTSASEYVPLISADESALMFTYRGERSTGGKQFVAGKKNANENDFFEDIMLSVKDSAGNWTEPALLQSNINTNGNDACVSLSPDAQTMLMFRSVPGDIGTLYKTTLSGNEWSEPVLLPGSINSKSWEGSITISPDGRMAYFASERPGGKGGRDIYRATLMPDSSWGNVVNAGDSINTALDDDAPFYHPSGQYLIICSRGHNSMGGFDIFRCDRINDSTWTKPKNLGYPINTPGEDIYYTITADGKKGFYSSGKTGGAGQQDIYSVEPGLPGAIIKLLQVSGLVTLNDKPANANIDIQFTGSNTVYVAKKSNSVTGRYLAALPVDRDFTLSFNLPGFDPVVRTISSKDLDGFLETTIDVPFYSADYLAKIQRAKDSLESLSNVKSDTSHGDLLVEYADAKAEGLTYRVQIGAYNLAQNFNYGSVMKLSKVEKIKLDDNITRFVMGKFDTYAQAKAFREQVVAAGITDAFVTAIYKGKRVFIRELVEIGVFRED